MAKIYLTIEGQIRGVRELYKRDDVKRETPFARAVSILTGSGSNLGDTAEVTVFTQDHSDAVGLKHHVGETVAWSVAADGNKYGLRLTYAGDIFPSTFHAAHDSQGLTSSQADALEMHL